MLAPRTSSDTLPPRRARTPVLLQPNPVRNPPEHPMRDEVLPNDAPRTSQREMPQLGVIHIIERVVG